MQMQVITENESITHHSWVLIGHPAYVPHDECIVGKSRVQPVMPLSHLSRIRNNGTGKSK
jgi:hypothetical protein